MKKNIVIALLLIVSIGSIGYITYDSLLKEEICDECICDNDCETEEDYYSYMMGYIDVNDKTYSLENYSIANLENGEIDLEWSNVKIEKKDNILYVNDKKIGQADELYVAHNYIFVITAGILGDVFTNVIDQKSNVINLENNKVYGDFQATNVYLKETGDIVAIGGKYCGIECVSTKEMVTFKNNNGKLEITKEKLK